MPKFDVENYVPVQERILHFWEDYPDGRIVTTVLSDPNIFDRIVIQAFVYKHRDYPQPDASDLAAEEKGQGGLANTTNWHENCSTSAIGRALANLGYATSSANRPSREEIQKANRMSGGADQSSAPQSGGGVTPRQLKYIEVLAREMGIDDDRLQAEVEKLYGRPVVELDRREASALVERMQTRRDQMNSPVPTVADDGS